MLLLATALTLLLGDAFELVRVSQAGSYKVAYSLVRVLGANRDTLAEARTDQYGRVRIELPPGTYPAEAVDGRTTYRFNLTITGGKALKRIELK
jgi:hypothetical protein